MFFGENIVSPSSTLCIGVLHHPHPDIIYSPDHEFSRGDRVELNLLAAGCSTVSAAGRMSSFSSRLCGGFAPTQPAGGIGWTSCRSALPQIRLLHQPLALKDRFLATRNRGLIRLLHTEVNPTPVGHFCPNAR